MSDSAAVEAEAVNYGAEFYPIGTAAAYAAKEDGKTVITIAISASRFQGQNFKYGFQILTQSLTHLLSNGRWRSVWQCTVDGRTGMN